ncbi:Pr6Pr family membrane protein [Microterricola viridarii]|uniref:Pr6Pr family membrane protein n=1 Tax=Microterricola viridarii TaxID=412690 RepID=UPI001E2B402B|nr:Pr6Pr family membrane protein [Microterricola viridarii]
MSPRAVGLWRVGSGVLVLAVLAYAFSERIAAGDDNPFDFFGYFTNLTCLLTSAVLIAVGARGVTARRVPNCLIVARGVALASLIVVAVIYNVVVPGTGSAPPWVSAVLHVAFPVAVALDWLLVGDRPPLPWRTLWLVLPYPLIWLAVVLVRGATDGWVPYGFLLPERGQLALAGTVGGLLAALLAAGVLTWSVSRVPALLPRPAAPGR